MMRLGARYFKLLLTIVYLLLASTKYFVYASEEFLSKNDINELLNADNSFLYLDNNKGYKDQHIETLNSNIRSSKEFQVSVTEAVSEAQPIAKSTLPKLKEVSDPVIDIQRNVVYPFDEKLNLRPLPNNFMLSSFTFDMNSTMFTPGRSSKDVNEYSHYTVFPKAFSSILQHTSAREMHIRFTRGFWDAESWGRLPNDGFKSGGSGVELWAVIEASSKDEAYTKWKVLANSLSGIFCASINFIDSSKTTYPKSTFLPVDEVPIFDSRNYLYVIRAALANEPVCTENLTPFVKLLPTKGKSGISTLLDGHRVFDSFWHSLSIDIKTRCDDTINMCYDSMESNVDVVMHVPNTIARADNPIPKPLDGELLRCDTSKPHDSYQCFPLPENTQTSFLLSKLFGKTLQGSNLISNNLSRVCAQKTKDWNVLIQLNDEFFGTSTDCFDLTENAKNDIYFETSNSTNVIAMDDVPVYVSRSLVSYGQDRSGLRTVFKNPTNRPVKLIYFESLPWFMRVYLSTLKLEPTKDKKTEFEIKDLLSSIEYLPAIDRQRPTHLEYQIEIPANTTIALSYQFEKTLLKYAEYPPDANHGFEIESAVITVIEPVKYQSRTTTLLLVLSTPDFSMPYNVIILTSTIMGLIFGTLFNLSVKRLITVEEAEYIKTHSGPKYKLKKLKERLFSTFTSKKKN